MLTYFPRSAWSAPLSSNPGGETPSRYPLERRVRGIAWNFFRHLPHFVGPYFITSFFFTREESFRDYAALGIASFTVVTGCEIFAHVIQRKYEKSDSPSSRLLLPYVENIAYAVARTVKAIFYFLTISTLVHEMGHAIASMALFNSPSPRIEINFLEAGTTYKPRSLSSLGEMLGWKNSLLLILGGGPLLGLIYDLALLTFAHYTKDDEMRVDFNISVLITTLDTSYYAVSALWVQSNKGHDFAQLYRIGNIHPLASALFFVVFPALFKLSLMGQDYLNDKFSLRVDS